MGILCKIMGSEHGNTPQSDTACGVQKLVFEHNFVVGLLTFFENAFVCEIIL